jgi:hypothetical protein
MLTHLDLHRDATHTPSGDVVTRDAGLPSAARDDVAAGRAVATPADARSSTPGPDDRLARRGERIALYFRAPRDRWRQWTSLVAVAVRSVGDRLRDGFPLHGGVRGTSDAAPADPPSSPDPYAGAETRSGGRVDGG